MRGRSLEVNDHLNAGVIVQRLGAARIDRQHPFGQAHYVPHVFEKLCHHEPGRFLQVNVLYNVMIGLDLGTGEPVARKLGPKNDDRSAECADRTFQGEIAVGKYLPPATDRDGTKPGAYVAYVTTQWIIGSTFLLVQLLL